MGIERDNNNDKSIISKNEINNNLNENLNYIGKKVDNKRVIFAIFKRQGIEILNSSLNTTTYEIFSNSDSNINTTIYGIFSNSNSNINTTTYEIISNSDSNINIINKSNI